jgi:hypothetical protein
MAQRPSFDTSKLSTADKILGGASLLLFIDSFLSWQKVCAPKEISQLIGINACVRASAWGGNGAFAGVLMALLSLLLLAGVVAMVMGYELPLTIPTSTVMAGLTAGTVLFGLIKFLFVVGNHIAFAAWVGLILLIAVAYGGYMKMQEQKAIPPTQGFTPPPPPPPAP